MDHLSKIWTTKDGRDVKVGDLTDEHLHNIIIYCRKVMFKAQESAKLKLTTLHFKDSYRFCSEQECISLGYMDEFMCEASGEFKYVLLEAKIRGLIRTPLLYSQLFEYCSMPH